MPLRDLDRSKQDLICELNALRQASQELQESKQRLTNLLANLPGMAYRCQNHPNWPVAFVSDHCYELTGYDAAELTLNPDGFNQIIDPLDREYVWSLVQDAIRHRESYIMEYRIRTKSGQTKWVWGRGMAVYAAEGHVAWLEGIILDVTDRKLIEIERRELEAKIQQSRKMEAIGTLAGGIAHDFNNILSAILGYAEMLEDDLFEQPHQRDNAEQIILACNRARDLVQQILTFSRKSEVEVEPVAVHLVAGEAMRFLRSTIPATVAIRQKIVKNCGLVLAEPIQIHQLFLNLCTNAYQAMESGGLMEVVLDAVDLDESFIIQHPPLKPGTHVRLSVSDTGCGMDHTTIERIFDPFFTTKDKGKGTGLGLATTYAIVKQLNGAISVVSQPGVGSQFTVYLPQMEMRQNETVLHQQASASQSNGEHIMLIDDEDTVLYIYRQILERLGYQVSVFSHWSAAFNQFVAEPLSFDLVITDLTMPGLSGDKLARKLLEVRPEVPIMLMTGYSDRCTDEMLEACGVFSFLKKPVSKADLASSVRLALDVGLQTKVGMA